MHFVIFVLFNAEFNANVCMHCSFINVCCKYKYNSQLQLVKDKGNTPSLMYYLGTRITLLGHFWP